MNQNNPQLTLEYLQPGDIQSTLGRLWKDNENEMALNLIREAVAQGAPLVDYSYLHVWAAAHGDPQLALELFDQFAAVVPLSPWQAYFADARQLPEFKEYLERMGIVDYWRSTGNWGDFCQPLSGNDDYECR